MLPSRVILDANWLAQQIFDLCDRAVRKGLAGTDVKDDNGNFFVFTDYQVRTIWAHSAIFVATIHVVAAAVTFTAQNGGN
ncbi:hypothetical protein QBC35DRAFT_535000 [Podospora australis]|uniref:Uncharacterized protein n=1 Tax=Podospora australis TaxID=1536484 RepID=A0AAN6WM83_9PEZI|nr:hypothetical protein QBC35DRAFT_535000 [Podospora australis]